MKGETECWSGTATPAASTIGPLAAQRDEALARGDTARAETLDRDPEIHLGRAAWMMLRTGEDNERTRRNDQIAEGNREREQESLVFPFGMVGMVGVTYKGLTFHLARISSNLGLYFTAL